MLHVLRWYCRELFRVGCLRRLSPNGRLQRTWLDGTFMSNKSQLKGFLARLKLSVWSAFPSVHCRSSECQK